MVLIVNRTEFFARIADEELILCQQQILLSQQCPQRFQWGHTMQSIIWREDFKFLFDFLNFQTRQTNGNFKSCNSHINTCRDAASTESK